MNSSEKQIAF